MPALERELQRPMRDVYGGWRIFKRRSNKTVPQSLELLKMDFSLYLRPMYQLCYQLKLSINSLSSVL